MCVYVRIEFGRLSQSIPAMQVSSFWLNSLYLGTFTSGYVPIRLRVDNVGALAYGEAGNVLAVRTDPSFGSGHWCGVCVCMFAYIDIYLCVCV